jgi:uncharacterized protein (UPF0332 family)
VTPETGEHLDKARACLTKSRALLDVMHYNDEAGRGAYLAGYHAAQALISERTGGIARSRSGFNCANGAGGSRYPDGRAVCQL